MVWDGLVFVGAYNKFGLTKARYRSRHACTSIPFSLFDSP